MPHPQPYKMASKAEFSPLLKPRPDFLGVGGCSVREANLFLEISSLCTLFHNYFTNEDLSKSSYTQCIDDQIDDLARNSYESSNEFENMTENGEETIRVLDYSEDNKANLVLYKINAATKQLFEMLDELNIDYTTEIYKPKQERLHVNPDVLYCKNLFLKDRKGIYYLVLTHEDSPVDLKHLRKNLNAHRNFSFVPELEMASILNVEAGGVTPLSLMYKMADHVKMVISNSLVVEGSSMMFHPLDANLATQMSLTDLLRFLKRFNHPVIFVE